MAATFPLLYPNRIQGILRPPGCKTWTTVSKHWPIEDETILSAVAGEEKNLWGLRWGEQSKFAVFDIDQGSKYHQAAELQKLQTKLAAIGLRATAYRSSERGGWHLYLFLDDWTDSNSFQNNRMILSHEGIIDAKDFLDSEHAGRPKWWKTQWIPFLYNGAGDYICIALDVDGKALPGRLITYWHDDKDRDVTYQNMYEWLKELVNSWRMALTKTVNGVLPRACNLKAWEKS